MWCLAVDQHVMIYPWPDTTALQYQDGGKFYNCTRAENLDLILLPEIDINGQVIIVDVKLCIISVLYLCDNIK